MFSEGGVTGRRAYEVSPRCAPIGAGLCASAFEEEMPQAYKVVADYKLLEQQALTFLSLLSPSNPTKKWQISEVLEEGIAGKHSAGSVCRSGYGNNP